MDKVLGASLEELLEKTLVKFWKEVHGIFTYGWKFNEKFKNNTWRIPEEYREVHKKSEKNLVTFSKLYCLKNGHEKIHTIFLKEFQDETLEEF